MAIDEHPATAQRPPLERMAAPNRTLPEPAARLRRWQRLFAILLSITDLIVVAVALAITQLIRFGTASEPVSIPGIPSVDQELSYTVLSVLLALGWALTLRLFGTRDPKIIGTGFIEYKRVTNATFAFFGLFAIASFVFQARVARAYLLIALPLGWILLMLSRWLWRKWLISRRRRGRLMTHALLVGDRASAAHVAEQIQRDPACGIRIVGALTEHGSTETALNDDVPVLGDWKHVLRHVDEARADTVILTGSHTLKPRQLRELGWGLEERKTNLIVAPALTDVAGPRIHSTPVAGLPLIHVDYPELKGIDRFLKRSFDVLGALGLIILSVPIMVIVAVAVKTTSPGPVLYGHERIGRYGVPFKMWKFRSMVDGANDELQSLLDAQGTSDRPLFKVNNDPRITPVGRVIRRFSLDELPQFFNVLMGSMSLVGPRPQVAGEVALYKGGAHRRLFMRPGISGLWQVSGRSNLDWDDAIRLDLYYVENWSLTGDIVILWRTLRAVMAKDGAY